MITSLSADERERVARFINETSRRFGAPPMEVLLHRHGIEKDNNMTEYDNTNRGVLFNERDKKTGDSDRDYGGKINIEGREFWLSAWIKTSAKGVKYMSLSVRPKDEPTKASDDDDFGGDSIPF
jgi:hypothetical protein